MTALPPQVPSRRLPPGTRARRFIPSVLLLLCAFAFWVWFNVKSFDLDSSKGSCSLQESEHVNPVEVSTYTRLMGHRFSEPVTHPVALITLTPGNEPLNVLTNTCDGRRFLAALVPAVARLGARVIAIDKFYSDGACTDNTVNQLFRSALNGVAPPVIVGQATHSFGEAHGAKDDCLVLTTPFDFQPAHDPGKPATPGKVHFGLTRLNENTLQIPLQWPVLETSADDQETPQTSQPHDGLALVIARQADPTLATDANLKSALKNGQHPFATFDDHLPQWSAMDVLCYGSAADLARTNGWGICSNIAHQPFRFKGKVVVIGEHVDSDLEPFPGGDRYGVDLHANYVESLLSRRFVHELWFKLDWMLVGLFVVLFGLVDLFAEEFLTSRAPGLVRYKEPLIVASGVVLLSLFACGSYLSLLYRDTFTPIFLLSTYPLLAYFFLRLVWYLTTAARDILHPPKEAA